MTEQEARDNLNREARSFSKIHGLKFFDHVSPGTMRRRNCLKCANKFVSYNFARRICNHCNIVNARKSIKCESQTIQ